MATTTTQTSDAAGDRRRARDQRGIRSAQAAKGDRLPSPPRQRRPALAALAVLLIVGGAAVAALLAMRVDSRVPVLQANQTIYPGQELTAEMFTTTSVAADDDTGLIPEIQINDVTQYYARTTIRPYQLLDVNMLSNSGFLDDGMVAVGASLPVGRYPAEGLQPGDVVNLVRVNDDGARVIVRNAQVSTLGGAAGAQDAAESGSTGVQISLIVSNDDSPLVAAAAANGQLSVILVDRGGDVAGSADAEASESDDADGNATDESDGQGEGEQGSSDEG